MTKLYKSGFLNNFLIFIKLNWYPCGDYFNYIIVSGAFRNDEDLLKHSLEAR